MGWGPLREAAFDRDDHVLHPAGYTRPGCPFSDVAPTRALREQDLATIGPVVIAAARAFAAEG